jgi:hypothetical protein
MRLLERDGDVFGLGDIVTHRLPIDDAPTAYANFQAEQDQTIKVVLRPYGWPADCWEPTVGV